MEVPHPTVAGRYRLVEQIGAGGMGVVWRAEDERLRRPVAVKLLRPPLGLSEDEAEIATQRAMREARITARLHHPHAVAVFDVVEHEGRPGLVMQYLPSVPLSAVLRDGGPLTLEETARLGAEVASALAAAHQLDIVHRDVKPGNILVAEDGSAMLSDFGISRVLGDATLTVTGMVHGTPAYLAPEVARGASSDAATDVYSLGSTLYAALEGSPPFGSDPNPILLLHKVANGEFPPPQHSGPMTPLLMRMLAVHAAGRPSMAEVASALAALRLTLDQGSAPTRPLAVPTREALAAEPTAPQPTAETPLLPAASTAATAATADHTAIRAAASSPAAPPPAAPVPGPPAAVPPPRRRGWLVALTVIVLLAALGAFLLADRNGTGAAAGPATTGAGAPRTSGSARSSGSGEPSASGSPSDSASKSPSASASESASKSPSESASASASASSTRSPTPSRTPSSTPTSPKSSSPTGEAELVRAVTDYYALLPRNTDAAWDRLTTRYQRQTGGRGGYDGFWDDFSRVSTSRVEANGNRVEATITYTYVNGGTTSERRSFTLVPDGGVLKIDASSL